jgi:hypothetical protein
MAKGKKPEIKAFGKGKRKTQLACKVSRRNGKIVGAKCGPVKVKAPKKRKATKKRKARKGSKKSRKRTDRKSKR